METALHILREINFSKILEVKEYIYLCFFPYFQRLLLPPWWEELQHLGFLETSPSSTLRPTSSAFEHYESEDDDLKKEDISFANNANLQATGNPYRSISLTPGALLAQKRSETSQSRTSNSSLEASASTIGILKIVRRAFYVYTVSLNSFQFFNFDFT